MTVLVTETGTENTMVNPLDSDAMGQWKSGVASMVFLLNPAPSDWPCMCRRGAT